MTYRQNWQTCNISCNWTKTVIYSFPSNFVDFALRRGTCQAEIWSQARVPNLLERKFDARREHRTGHIEQHGNWKPWNTSCNQFVLRRPLLNQLRLAINQEKILDSQDAEDRLAIKVCFPWREIEISSAIFAIDLSQIPFHARFPMEKKMG